MNLIGTWQKTTTAECSSNYPATIEFKGNGLYQAQADAQAATHPVWDVGTFSTHHDTVHLSTSTDAVIGYKTTLQANLLTFHDPEGCAITYKKAP